MELIRKQLVVVIIAVVVVIMQLPDQGKFPIEGFTLLSVFVNYRYLYMSA